MIAPVVNVGVVGVRVPQGLVPVRMAVRLPRWIVWGVPVSVVFVVDVKKPSFGIFSSSRPRRTVRIRS